MAVLVGNSLVDENVAKVSLGTSKNLYFLNVNKGSERLEKILSSEPMRLFFNRGVVPREEERP